MSYVKKEFTEILHLDKDNLGDHIFTLEKLLFNKNTIQKEDISIYFSFLSKIKDSEESINNIVSSFILNSEVLFFIFRKKSKKSENIFPAHFKVGSKIMYSVGFGTCMPLIVYDFKNKRGIFFHLLSGLGDYISDSYNKDNLNLILNKLINKSSLLIYINSEDTELKLLDMFKFDFLNNYDLIEENINFENNNSFSYSVVFNPQTSELFILYNKVINNEYILLVNKYKIKEN